MKPYLICHMAASVDGRITTAGWNLSPEGRAEYERTAATYHAEAWMCGRITMAAYARGTAPQAQSIPVTLAKTDFVAPHTETTYAVAVDPRGKLYWHTNAIDGDHVVAVLTEQVSDDYLACLQAQQVSYLFAGTHTLDVASALDKLAALFQVKTVLLEGGGKLNGAMLRAGLIDELSLLVAPLADGTNGTPTVFDALEQTPSPVPVHFLLQAVEQRADGIVWLRYRRSSRETA